jgi:hypothetical protein
MITNTGKNIVAKYLIGQAPSYASYMAFGSGPKPKDELANFTSLEYNAFAEKECLDFEMFRTPITSRGYITEYVGGVPVSKVVLTAEVPPEQRYQITEVGLYSARSNPSASGRDSRIVYTFTEAEDWQFHGEGQSSSLGSVITEPLGTTADVVKTDLRANSAFVVSSDNVIFSSPSRQARYEGGRYLNNIVMVPGNMSWLQRDPYTNAMMIKPKDITYNGTHIHNSGITINLDKNSSEDLIKTAFTVINKNGADVKVPTKVWILVEFSSSDSANPSSYARLAIEVTDATLTSNRYVVDTQQIGDLEKSENFSWSDVNIVKIYATAFETIEGSDLPSSNFYIGLDALRIENVTSNNPLYGLTGYSVIQSQGADPLVKEPNSSNLVEFRFGLDVV